MKIIVLALALVGCAHPAPPVAPSAPMPNLAVKAVHEVNAGLSCDPYFTDAGEHHTHSAVCKTPTGPAYCILADDKFPVCPPLFPLPPEPKPEPKAEAPKVEPPAPPKGKAK